MALQRVILTLCFIVLSSIVLLTNARALSKLSQRRDRSYQYGISDNNWYDADGQYPSKYSKKYDDYDDQYYQNEYDYDDKDDNGNDYEYDDDSLDDYEDDDDFDDDSMDDYEDDDDDYDDEVMDEDYDDSMDDYEDEDYDDNRDDFDDYEDDQDYDDITDDYDDDDDDANMFDNEDGDGSDNYPDSQRGNKKASGQRYESDDLERQIADCDEKIEYLEEEINDIKEDEEDRKPEGKEKKQKKRSDEIDGPLESALIDIFASFDINKKQTRMPTTVPSPTSATTTSKQPTTAETKPSTAETKPTTAPLLKKKKKGLPSEEGADSLMDKYTADLLKDPTMCSEEELLQCPSKQCKRIPHGKKFVPKCLE